MRVFVDGEGVTLDDSPTLKDALDAAGIIPREIVILGIVKGRTETARETNSYWLNTTKGKLRIELLETDLQKIWHDCVDYISGAGVRWADSRGLAFGSFPSSFVPTSGVNEYNRWEVVLGAGGFESTNTQVIFVGKRHTAAYGVPYENRGVFAKIVGGKNILDKLEADDKILSVEPIVEWEDLTDKLSTQDLSYPLSEGMEIFTRIAVDLIEDAPLGSEFFLASTHDDLFKVDSISSSYISSDILVGERIEFENREPRLEGTVSIRTSGKGTGKIFIYKADRTSIPAHSVAARVTSGMDLVKLAQPGQYISVKVSPERIMLMGETLRKAMEIALEREIEYEVEGYTGDDAVVVKQEPATTMGVLKEGRVKLTAIPAKRLVAIELYDELAPKSIDYFRHVVGLKEKPVGPLPVYFVYENTVLFTPEIKATSYKELLPENKPSDLVLSGEIGVTNQVAKRVGLIGVKLADDKKYGPSGERFEATNIIGQVLELDKLSDVEEGETVYVLEVRR